MNPWKQIKLRDVAILITKGTTPTTLGYNFVESGINFVKSEAVTDDGQIDRTKFVFIDDETNRALKRSILQEGDVLFSMAGVFIGKTAVVTNAILPANTNQAVGIIRLDKNKAIPKFIHYFLHNKSYNEYINSLVAQSAQPNLNLAQIGNLPILLPDPSEQIAIAEILGTIDDKIQLNRRMNTTLEGIIWTLFKSWFINFDPVHAKANRRPSIDAETAKLFPSALQEDIPEGWKFAQFRDFLTPVRDRIEKDMAPEYSATVNGLSLRDENSISHFLNQKKKTRRLSKTISFLG